MGRHEHLIIYCTDDFLKHLILCRTVYCDGTFKICPRQFQQIFTFSMMYGARSIPMLWVLMTHSDSFVWDDISMDFWKAIMINDNPAHINQPLRWITIVSDFESGFLPAIQAALPLVNQRGCHIMTLQYFGKSNVAGYLYNINAILRLKNSAKLFLHLRFCLRTKLNMSCFFDKSIVFIDTILRYQICIQNIGL